MNTIFRYYIVLAAWLVCTSAIAQSEPESNYQAEHNPIPFLSPEAASLGKYGEIPVSEYTGVPQIDIPLYTVKSGELELPISLSYHASGIKVNQEATWVGLGWDLMAGGCISRVVSGKNDLAEQYYQNEYEDDWLKQLLNLNDNNTFSSTIRFYYPYSSGISENQKNFYQKLINHNYEPDIFTANFCGHNISFYIDPYNNDIIQLGKLSGNFKIEKFHKGNLIDIDSWIITDNLGIKYYFGGNATEKYLNLNYEADVLLYAPTWNLYKIEHPVNGNINLIYTDPFKIWPTPEVSETFRWLDQREEDVYGYPELNNSFGAAFVGRVTPYLDLESHISNQNSFPGIVSPLAMRKPYISRIVTDNCVIDFQLNDRNDINGQGKKLSSLVIKDNNDSIKHQKHHIYFYHSYFHTEKITYENKAYQGHYCDSKKNERLRLDSLKIDDNCYSFSYNSTSLPSKTSNSQDYWGYYNGKNNKHLVGIPPYVDSGYGEKVKNLSFHNESFINANRMPDISFIKAGILESVVYPTKGKTLFEYEMHTFNNDTFPYASMYPAGTSNCEGGGLRIKKKTNLDIKNNVVGKRNYSYNSGCLMTPNTFVKKESKYYVKDVGEGPELVYANIYSVSSSFSNPAFTSVFSTNIGYSEVAVNENGKKTISTFVNSRPNWSLSTSIDDAFHVTHYDTIESISETRFFNRDFKFNEGFHYWNALNNGNLLEKKVYDANNHELFSSEKTVYKTISKQFGKINMYAVNPCENAILTLWYCPTFRILAYPFVSERTVPQMTFTKIRYGDSFVCDTVFYSYNDSTYLLNKLQKSTEIPGKYQTYNIKYPTDKVDGISTQVSTNMISRNMLAYPLETSLSFMGNTIERNRNIYTNTNIGGSSIPVLTERQWAQGTLDFKTRLKVQYDSHGNCVEVRKSDNIPTSYVWGYNWTLPVAVLPGVSYNTIDTSTINTIGQSSDPSLNKDYKDLPSNYTLGKFYTYDPLVGIKTESSTNGYMINYDYDSFGRLRQMYDNLGGPKILLKSFEYNYGK